MDGIRCFSKKQRMNLLVDCDRFRPLYIPSGMNNGYFYDLVSFHIPNAVAFRQKGGQSGMIGLMPFLETPMERQAVFLDHGEAIFISVCFI